MNQKTLFKLEYDKIIALLEKEATSFRGGQLCRRLKPMTDINKINTFQEQTAAAFMIHRKNPVTVWMLFLNSLNRLPLWQMRLSGVSPGKMKSVMMQAPH